MNKKTTILSIVILVVAFLAGWVLYTYVPAFTQQEKTSTEERGQVQTNNSSGNINGGPGYRQMVKMLDMSPEQASQFSEIESNYRQKVSELTQQLDSIDTAILSEIQKENPDKDKLEQLSARAGDIQYALKKATTSHFLEVKEICTPDQREKFNEVISDLGRYRQGRRQGPRDGRGRKKEGRGRRWNNQ